MTAQVPEEWTRVERPPSLFRRFEFDSYAQTRAFLERLAALSEETGCYPDLGFGTRHVNVTVYAANGSPAERESDFARRAGPLAVAGSE